MRATAAVFLSIPLSALAAFLAINAGGGTVNTMVLGGLALVFSRLIDNSVIVLENIFRHIEAGEPPEIAAEKGGQEVALAVLAATHHDRHCVLPGRFPLRSQPVPVHGSGHCSCVLAFRFLLCGHDRGATVCAKLVKKTQADEEVGEGSIGARFGKIAKKFDHHFETMLHKYDLLIEPRLLRPAGNVDRTGWCLSPFSFPLSASWRGLFPAHRSRTIRDQLESAIGNTGGTYAKNMSSKWNRSFAMWFLRMNCRWSFPTSESLRIFP